MNAMTELKAPTKVPGARLDVSLLRDLVKQGKTETEISRLMGFERRTIRKKMRDLGLVMRRRSGVTVDMDRLLELYAQGVVVPKIAEALGVNQSCVWNHIRKAGLPKRRSRAPVDANAPSEEQGETDELTTETPAEETPPPVVAPVLDPEAIMLGAVLATKGRWRDLAAFADRHGMTHARAQQLYHRARAGA